MSSCADCCVTCRKPHQHPAPQHSMGPFVTRDNRHLLSHLGLTGKESSVLLIWELRHSDGTVSLLNISVTLVILLVKWQLVFLTLEGVID